MSTYNGSLYIRDQLESIVSQTVQDKSLLIRDDGSIDNTVAIIQEYQKKYSWISYYEGKNLGVQKSFFDLISNSDEFADYISFADQDDVWNPRKLENAILAIQLIEKKSASAPVLYCSNQTLVDTNLDLLHITVSRIVKKISFGNALVQNICTGCTAVGNSKLIELLKKHIPLHPESIIMHDWWFYLTASCFGYVVYDENSYIYYRQHRNNTLGAIHNRKALVRHRFKELRKMRGEIYRQTEEFKNCYMCLLQIKHYSNNLKSINKLLNAKRSLLGRLLVIFDKTYFRQKRSDNLIFKGIVLLGKL